MRRRVRKEVIIVRDDRDIRLQTYTLDNKYELMHPDPRKVNCVKLNFTGPVHDLTARFTSLNRSVNDQGISLYHNRSHVLSSEFVVDNCFLVQIDETRGRVESPDLKSSDCVNFEVGDHVFPIYKKALESISHSELTREIPRDDEKRIQLVKIKCEPENFWVLAEYLNYRVPLHDLGLVLVKRLRIVAHKYRLMEICNLCDMYLKEPMIHGIVAMKRTREIEYLEMNSYKPILVFDNCGSDNDFSCIEEELDARLINVYIHVHLPLRTLSHGVEIRCPTPRGLVIHKLHGKNCSCEELSQLGNLISQFPLICCSSSDFTSLFCK